MSSLIQNILILGGVVVLAAIGYFLYTNSMPLREQDSAVSQQVAAQSEDFLKRLNELKAVRLNGDIFADPRFISLVNNAQPVIPQPVGRTNPFEQHN